MRSVPPLVMAPIVDEIESNEAGSELFPPTKLLLLGLYVLPIVVEDVKVDVELCLSPKDDSVVDDRLCCVTELFDCKVLVLLTLPLRSFVRSLVLMLHEEDNVDFVPEGGKFVKLVSLVAEVLTVIVGRFWLLFKEVVVDAVAEVGELLANADVEPIIKLTN